MNDHTPATDDPFLVGYNATDLRIAEEFLSNWLPFLSRDLCHHCNQSLSDRVRSLHQIDNDAEHLKEEESFTVSKKSNKDRNDYCGSQDNCEDTNSLGSWKDGADINDNANSLGGCKDGTSGVPDFTVEVSTSETVHSPVPVRSPRVRMSWADMAQEDELEEEEEEEKEVSSHLINDNGRLGDVDVVEEVKLTPKPELSRDLREQIRFSNVKRKKDFICLERINGKIVNILAGLELHTDVFSAVEQKKIVDFIYELQEKGKNGELKERTYTAPQKWMRGKGRVTIQFGCCYNYAMDKNGNPPGILQKEIVDPIPSLLKVIVKRLIRWHVLPPTCVPDSCIINIYEEGDCIPPHIDSHDFVRPFCTVSFLSKCNIVFGSNLRIEGPGEFYGAFAIPLPVGSVLVLNGNGADVVKHCVPAVPTKRISITFRKMDESKWPIGFAPEPDLQGLEPMSYEENRFKGSNPSKSKHPSNRQAIRKEDTTKSRGVLGSQPRYYGQNGYGGPAPANRRRVRQLEY